MPTNDFYNHGSVPQNGTPCDAPEIFAEFDSVMAGFAKLPTMTGNGGKVVKVNAGGTALETQAADAMVAATIHAATSKTTPVDADELGIVDSAASNGLKKLTFANLGAWIWSKLGALIAAGTGKTTPADADSIAISDSAATNATKTMTFANLWAWIQAKMLNPGSNADIASAATVDLTAATGNTVTITGTTATSAFTMNDGQHMTLVAAAAWPLTYHATTMNIAGGASVTAYAGQVFDVFKTGGVIRVYPQKPKLIRGGMRSSGNTTPSAATWTKIATTSTVAPSNNGVSFDAGTSKLTVLASGVYEIHVNAFATNATTTQGCRVVPYLNGASISSELVCSLLILGGYSSTNSCQGFFEFTAGDELELYCYSTIASSTFSAVNNTLHIAKIGEI